MFEFKRSLRIARGGSMTGKRMSRSARLGVELLDMRIAPGGWGRAPIVAELHQRLNGPVLTTPTVELSSPTDILRGGHLKTPPRHGIPQFGGVNR
jgi:hypothetical protein